MVRYISKREQALKYFEEVVLPIIWKDDVEEKKLVAWITSQTGINPKLIQEIIENNVILNKIARSSNGFLTIPTGDIVNFLKATKKEDPLEVLKDEVA
jgi:hypothetical protein